LLPLTFTTGGFEGAANGEDGSESLRFTPVAPEEDVEPPLDDDELDELLLPEELLELELLLPLELLLLELEPLLLLEELPELELLPEELLELELLPPELLLLELE
jgi:hypothetical protein